MTSDLVGKLRDLSPGPSWEMTRIGNEAAARIERLEAALRFYAGWPQGSAGNIAPFLMDAGRIARAALEGK